MSKIFRHSQTEEINYFLNNNPKISDELKTIIQDDLNEKIKKYNRESNSIWLIERSEAVTIDVFNIRGEVFETDTYFFSNYN